MWLDYVCVCVGGGGGGGGGGGKGYVSPLQNYAPPSSYAYAPYVRTGTFSMNKSDQ